MRNRGSTNKFRCRSAVMILFAVAGSLLVSAWATPNPSKTDNELNGVSAISSTDAWAVGYYGVGAQGSGEANTLALHWNGTKWAKVSSPNPLPGQTNQLSGVYARAANNWNWLRFLIAHLPLTCGIASSACPLDLEGLTPVC